MRHVINLALLITALTVQAQTKYDISFNFDDHKRELIVSVPTSSPPVDGYPVVVMLHGRGGDKNVFYNAHGWKALGEQENFITVFPSALSWCFFEDGNKEVNTKWACGGLVESICPSDSADLISDVAFLREIILRLRDTFPINSEKVFISGFSNGGCMTHKMAMAAGDIFKAAGAASGGYNPLDSVTPDHRVPLWFMVGTKDHHFIAPPFTEIPFGGDSILYYFSKLINRTLASQGLRQNYTLFETANTKTYEFTECLPGTVCAPYRLTVINGLDHKFPNGKNHPIDAPLLLWNFFNQPPSVTTANGSEYPPDWTISSAPNPSYDQMLLQFGNIPFPVKMTIIHPSGAIVSVQDLHTSECKLEKSQLGTGLFIVRLETDAGTAITKVLFL